MWCVIRKLVLLRYQVWIGEPGGPEGGSFSNPVEGDKHYVKLAAVGTKGSRRKQCQIVILCYPDVVTHHGMKTC